MQAFLDRVLLPDEDDGCWLWTGTTDRKGYGQITLAAHRLAYELIVGEIPPDHVIDHLCRNPGCVNPAHLEPVTLRENILRGVAPSSLNARKTHCPSGHPYDAVNTRIGRDGSRYCRACHRERMRPAMQRKRAAA